MAEEESWKEVGRVLLPVPVKGLSRMASWLTKAYGETYMSQSGQWLVFSVRAEP